LTEQYDLKKSEEGIGQLYPILEAKDGSVIDGFHREEVDRNWKRVRLGHIDTEEKKLVARLVANFHRRQITREEKEEWINGLARIYKKQGIKIVAQKIMEVTGLSDTTIYSYLSSEYKDKKQSEVGKAPKPSRVSASQAIKSKLGDYGEQLVERHREEVLAQEKPKIEKEVRTKLLKDPIFQRQVVKEIQKPQLSKEVCPVLPPIEADIDEPMLSPSESTTKITCPNCGYKFTIEEAKII